MSSSHRKFIEINFSFAYRITTRFIFKLFLCKNEDPYRRIGMRVARSIAAVDAYKKNVLRTTITTRTQNVLNA